MGDRRAGRSSIGFFESIYYMVKVFLAIFVLTLRRPNRDRREPMDKLANVEVFRIQVLAIIGSLALIVFILELIRRKRLKEEFSLLWLGMGVVFLVISLFRGLLDKFSILVGIGYPPAALFRS